MELETAVFFFRAIVLDRIARIPKNNELNAVKGVIIYPSAAICGVDRTVRIDLDKRDRPITEGIDKAKKYFKE